MTNNKRVRSIGIFGLGRAGKSLFLSCHQRGFPVAALGTRSAEVRKQFRGQLNGQIPLSDSFATFLKQAKTKECECIILAIPDDAISGYLKRLSRRKNLPPIICHLSGARGAESTDGVDGPISISCFHPLASLRGDRAIPDGALVGIQSPQRSTLKHLSHLATDLGLTPTEIKSKMNSTYHLAATLTANLPLALIAESIEMMTEAGIPRQLAQKSLGRLLESVVCELDSNKPLWKILTGPVAREDIQTINRHLNVLDSDPELKQIYQLLGHRLLKIPKVAGSQRGKLREILKIDTAAS